MFIMVAFSDPFEGQDFFVWHLSQKDLRNLQNPSTSEERQLPLSQLQKAPPLGKVNDHGEKNGSP